MKRIGKLLTLVIAGCLILCVGVFMTSCGKEQPATDSQSTEPEEQNPEAESLFYAYDGNHSAMGNDGVYEKYKSYNVSKEQEAVWFQKILEEKRDAVSKTDGQNKSVKLAYCQILEALRQGKKYMSSFRSEYEQIVKTTIEFLSDGSIESLPDDTKMYVYTATFEMLDYIDDEVDCGNYGFGLRYHLVRLQNDTKDAKIKASAEALFNKTYSIQEWEDAE